MPVVGKTKEYLIPNIEVLAALENTKITYCAYRA